MNDRSAHSLSQNSVPVSDQRPAKRQKVAVACDVCRAKKIKCDGTKPICGPCAKRADRGVPCEYTSESRTSHGPSKGYVHHLESKLRELQSSAASRDSFPPDRHVFRAINMSQVPSAWEAEPSTVNQTFPSFGYNVSNERTTRATPPQLPDTSQRPSDSSSFPAVILDSAPGNEPLQSSAHPRRTDLTESQNTVASGHGSYSLTPSAFHGKLERIPQVDQVGGPGRPLYLDWTRSGLDREISGASPKPSNSSKLRSYTPRSFTPRLYGSSSKTRSSFLKQIREVLDARSHVVSPPMSFSSPSTNLPAMPPKSRVPEHIDYDLPSRKTADNLVKIYWDLVHPIFPFLDRQQFEESYSIIWSGGQLKSDESLTMCILNVVFALASQHSDTLGPQDRETSSDKFFDRAQDLLKLDLWGVGSVQLVQALLLMSQYLQNVHSLHQCWMVGGMAMRIAESLGLHLAETSEEAPNIRSREILRRVWHGCLMMDGIISAQFGRPAMVDKPSAKAVPLPLPIDDEYLETFNQGQTPDKPQLLAYYRATLEATDILARVQKLSAAIEDPNIDRSCQYQLLLGIKAISNTNTVFDIDQAVTSWHQNLPAHLKTYESQFPNVMLNRQAELLRFRHLHMRMLTFRSVLSRFCLLRTETPILASKFYESLPQRLALSCSALCLRSACDLIEIVHERLKTSSSVAGTPVGWNVFLFVYTSATILQATRLHPLVESSVEGYDRERLWHQTIEILKNFERLGPTAQRSIVALEILSEKITQAISTRRELEACIERSNSRDAYAEGLPTPAPSAWTKSAVGAAAPIAEPLQEELAPGGLLISGLSEPFDLEDFDFNLNDLSWLSSVPFDL